MSVLKLQPSLRYINPQQKVSCLCAVSSSNNILLDNGGVRQNGTVSSSLARGINSGNQEKVVKTSDTNIEHGTDTNTSESISVNKEVTDTKGKGFSFGVTVPLKISEMNRYVSETSRRWMKAGLKTSFSNKNNNSSSQGSSEDTNNSSAYSLEQTVLKMNQSILSFYDTSCVIKDSVHERVVDKVNSVQSNSSESQDEEQLDIPQSTGPLFPIQTTEAKIKKAKERRAEKISRMSLESRTRALVQSLRSAHSLMSKLTRAEELCDHLIAHPECVWDAAKEKTVPLLLEITKSPDKNLKGLAYQCLSLLGHAKPLKSPGIRLLSIDGGGTRGLVAIEFLKALEKQSGKKIHELFDYICGVSTGALIAVMICYKVPLDRCEELYKDCSIRTFTRNRVMGATKLVWKHGFYDSHIWENILQTEFGPKALIEFARENDVPKMSAVSSLISAPRMTSFLFRTYNPPYGVKSQYPGSCKYKIWQVIRASSAAPGYFEPFNLEQNVHEDGGVLNNNPTALAIHESRLLWERENLHCVVSLGTGRFAPTLETPAKLSLKRRISSIVDSATDTEGVHYTLQDLLPAKTYFRFNPYLSEEFFLDEIRVDKMAQMQHDARMYSRRNSYKLIAASERLVEKRKVSQIARDYVRRAIEKI